MKRAYHCLGRQNRLGSCWSKSEAFVSSMMTPDYGDLGITNFVVSSLRIQSSEWDVARICLIVPRGSRLGTKWQGSKAAGSKSGRRAKGLGRALG